MKLYAQHPPVQPDWAPVRQRGRAAFGKELSNKQ
jgi:hypothetical protein